jgi:hypothetical protein
MLLIIGVPMNQKRVYKSYPKEFKEEAVEAAKSLGIRAKQLYDWKAKIEASKQDGALSDDERGECIFVTIQPLHSIDNPPSQSALHPIIHYPDSGY